MTASLYRGFNTIDQRKKFTLTGFELVKRDLLNAFSIRLGEVPGRPSYGSGLLNLIFEPMTPELVQSVETEILRIARADPRMSITNIAVYAGDHAVIVELDLTVLPNVSTQRVAMVFDQASNKVSYR